MNDNNRQELRLGKDETIFIETRSVYPGNPENCKILICRSVDVSANGLKVCVDEKLPVDAIYQLCIELHETRQKIYLSVQVKWVVAEAGDEGYSIGLSIFESDDTDIEQWKLYIASELASARACKPIAE